MFKKKIAISAINLFEGGPLSVLKDCLQAIENSSQFEDYGFVALVHKINLFDVSAYKKVTFVEFPKSRTSYFYRLYYEYFYFNKFAIENKIDFWFSLHDISPNVGTVPQAVYCHNPSPFKQISFKELFIQPVIFMFNLFYSFLYKINIKKNKYVVVQQLWLKGEFSKRFGVQYTKIVIAKPQEAKVDLNSIGGDVNKTRKSFVFPTFPRSFKNIEVIGEAVQILDKEGVGEFSVTVTIDGSENKYSRNILDKYGKLRYLNFIGLQPRETVYQLYKESDCLIFPSTLETWGLPISEYKQFDKPMLVAKLPYARETVGGYDKAKFFNPNDSQELASYMKEFILLDKIDYDTTKSIDYPKPYVQDWEALMVLLIK
ncbi:glycosyltransferase [Flavobacterium petrolei]|uniref:glycosyltransferase n=1 Tax=Flavobacterium petrolei TaxID=2259594 RepID=UPI003757C421